MPTPRDMLRVQRNKIFQKANAMGIDLEPERIKPGSNQRTLAHAAKRMINEPVPSISRESLQVDAPPAGAFNSANTTFVLSALVAGLNIGVTFGRAGGVAAPLRRTDSTPPGTGEFYLDKNAPMQIVLGDVPDAADTLIATYKTVR